MPVLLSDSTISGWLIEDVDVSSKTGFGVGAKIGSRYEPFRIDLELSYKTNDIDQMPRAGVRTPVDGDFSSLAAMLNGYVDIKTAGPLTPFIGGGFGLAILSIEAKSGTEAIAGVGFKVRPDLTLDAAYKFFTKVGAPVDPFIFPIDDVDYTTHNFTLGVRFDF